MGSSQTRKGYITCLLLGCDLLVVLRNTGENRFVFIVECYAHGIIDGEAIDELAARRYEATEIRIY